MLEVYCDGSGDAKVDRPGGWAYVVVRDGEVLISRTGHAAKTTCLVMELRAARAGLLAVTRRDWQHEGVVLISDSSIALDIAAGRFMPKPPKYHALARSLRGAAEASAATTKWVRAHAGHRWNEHVDALARRARLGSR